LGDRRNISAFRDDAGGRGACGAGKDGFSRFARHMDRRRAVRVSEQFGVEQTKTRTHAGANNHQGAVRGLPAKLVVEATAWRRI
jgi:hypothetical protein